MIWYSRRSCHFKKYLPETFGANLRAKRVETEQRWVMMYSMRVYGELYCTQRTFSYYEKLFFDLN